MTRSKKIGFLASFLSGVGFVVSFGISLWAAVILELISAVLWGTEDAVAAYDEGSPEYFGTLFGKDPNIPGLTLLGLIVSSFCAALFALLSMVTLAGPFEAVAIGMGLVCAYTWYQCGETLDRWAAISLAAASLLALPLMTLIPFSLPAIVPFIFDIGISLALASCALTWMGSYLIADNDVVESKKQVYTFIADVAEETGKTARRGFTALYDSFMTSSQRHDSQRVNQRLEH